MFLSLPPLKGRVLLNMNYRILANKTKTKAQLRKSALKWTLYILCMLIFYSIMRSGAFSLWQPFLIIPLAVSVALHERELPACIFALFCGYLIDIACRFIFGFSTVWLMLVCLAASLLSRNLIRINLINFIWIDILAIFLEFFMDYLFNTLIWDIPNREIVLERSTIPSAVSTLIISPFIYLLVKFIYNKLDGSGSFNNYSPDVNSNDDDYILKN